MGTIRRDVTVSCPPEQIFGVLARVERLPEFSGMTVEVRNGPGRDLQVGDRFAQVVTVLGKELESDWVVTEFEAPRLLRLEGTAAGGARASLTERLTPEGTGTHVELEVDYDMPLGILGDAVDAIYFHGKNEEQAEEILSRLKALCEGTA